MPTTNTILKSQLQGSLRIDAQFYQPRFIANRLHFTPSASRPLGILAQTFRKGIFDINASSYSDNGVPFIRILNLGNGLIDDSDLVYIPEEIHQREFKTALQQGDIILSKTAYPAASLVNIQKCNTSQDTIAVRIDSRWKREFKAGFIVAFLNSQYGLLLMEQWFQGNIQMHLALPDAKRIPIPKFSIDFQTKIESLLWKADDELKGAKSVLSEANSLLLDTLSLLTWEPPHLHSFAVQSSRSLSTQRLDAEHFQPKYDDLLARISTRFRCLPLSRLVTFINHGKQPPYSPDGNHFVFTQKFIGDSTINYDFPSDPDTKRTSSSFANTFPDYVLGKFDILHYSVGGNIGYCHAYLEPAIKAMPGSFVTLIRANADLIQPLYLAFTLNSLVGRMQTHKWKSATAQPYIYPKDIKRIAIPILPSEIQTQISSAIEHAHEARKEAHSFLSKATRSVEIAIEQGEQSAMAFLNGEQK